MAQVPEATGVNVLPTSAPQPLQQIASSPASFGAPVAAGLESVAGADKKASDVLEKHAQVIQGLTNKADADTATTGLDGKLNDIYTKYITQNQMGAALPALNPAIAEMNKARMEYRATLTSPMAQSFFDADSRRTQLAFANEMGRHAATQENQYQTKSSQDRITSAGDLLAAHPNDPQFEDNFLQVVHRESNFLALNSGMDKLGDNTHAKILALAQQGKVFSEVAKDMAVTDPDGAMTYLRAHADLMDPKTFVNTQTQLRPSVMANDAASVAHTAVAQVLGGAGSQAPTTIADAATYFSNLAGGNVTITSGARDAAHNAEVGGVPGSEHIPGQGVAYDMTPPPGMTTAQLAAKLKASVPDAHQILDEGDHVHVGWAHGSSATAGLPPTSADLQAKMAGALAAADAAAERKYPHNALFRDQVEARAQAELNRQINAAKDMETAAYTALGSSVINNNIQDLHTLLSSSPEALQQFNSLPLGMRTALQADMKRNASELTPTKQANYVAAMGTYANRANDPQAFLNADFASMDLRPQDRLSLMKSQAEFRAKPVAEQDKPFNAIIHSPQFADTLSALGISKHAPNTPPGTITSDYSHVLGAVNAELDNWRAQNPQKMPDQKDSLGILARATAEVSRTKTGLFGLGDEKVTRAFDIPPDQLANVDRAVKALGLPPGEESRAKVYRDYKLRGGK